jgi:phosphate transport system permease protein
MPQQSRLLALGPEGRIGVIPLQGEGQTYEVIRAAREEITLFELLPGRRSLMLGDQSGALSQWFFVPDEYNSLKLQQIRQYDPLQSAPKRLAGREQDNSFITLEQNGTLSVYSLTSSRALLRTNLLGDEPEALALSAYNSFLLMERNNRVSSWQLQAPHAEITLSSLWSEIWHEDYDEPGYIWQSSTNGTDSAAKYSLVPLVFGTLKAALYAMLMATPMAICGAIYTAYFMAPALRRKIKPMIEMMAAVPSVVLGFLAGLWLAPFMQVHLAAILLLVLLLPISILLFAFGWEKMPQRIRFLLPEGWDVILLLGVIPLVAWLAFLLAVPIEAWLFDGQLVLWLGNQVGISYDQRNALIVGIAMGFAIIPTLFSLTEDAIHAVPRHLSNGALALGATPWQALTWMILPAASAGIFSALMIGFGRAIGETMIVLMVTGNTPIMEMNIFEGMRTLAANIAIEMPESSVGSSHYRVLFLTALLLFLFTLVVNTIAELIRQQLRRKYRAL